MPTSVLEHEYDGIVEEDGDPDWVDDTPACWDQYIADLDSDSEL